MTARQTAYHQLFARSDADGKLSFVNRLMVFVILIAVATTIIGTEATIRSANKQWFILVEFGFGIIFAIEYVARVWSVAEDPGEGSATAKRLRFVVQPLALLDLFVVLATLSPFFVSDASILRIVRLLRLAALAKFGRFSRALQELASAINQRRYELFVTMALATGLLLFGATALFWAEREIQPEAFGSIPRAVVVDHHPDDGGLWRCLADHAGRQVPRLHRRAGRHRPCRDAHRDHGERIQRGDAEEQARGRRRASGRKGRGIVKKDDIFEMFRRLAESNPAPETELAYGNTYQLLVAVVLSAQATDVGVNKATKKLFEDVLTPQEMLALGEDGLKQHIKSIGLFNSKAKNVIALSEILVREHGGEVPQDRDALVELPGVGRKTANVVMNCAFGAETFAVDTHIFRVCNRTGLAKGKTPLAVEKGLEKKVPQPFRQGAHHWLILHGRYICKARTPECWRCPIVDLCGFKAKVLERRGRPSVTEKATPQ